MERLVGGTAGERREGVIPMGAIRDGMGSPIPTPTPMPSGSSEGREFTGELVHLLGQRLLCERGACPDQSSHDEGAWHHVRTVPTPSNLRAEGDVIMVGPCCPSGHQKLGYIGVGGVVPDLEVAVLTQDGREAGTGARQVEDGLDREILGLDMPERAALGHVCV